MTAIQNTVRGSIINTSCIRSCNKFTTTTLLAPKISSIYLTVAPTALRKHFKRIKNFTNTCKWHTRLVPTQHHGKRKFQQLDNRNHMANRRKFTVYMGIIVTQNLTNLLLFKQTPHSPRNLPPPHQVSRPAWNVRSESERSDANQMKLPV